MRTVELVAGRDAPGRAREWLGWVGRYLEPGQLDAARLMVSELVSNSVEHSGMPEGGPIQVCATGSDRGIRVSVRDRGHGLESAPAPELPSPNSSGRRGLWIVHRLADSVTIDGAEGRVAFVLARGPSLL
jgi:anti-sigma regulatory factor (Ser/Thr protein kinase)